MERCIRAGVFVLVVLVVGVVCTVTLSLDVAVHPEAALRSFQRYCDRVSFDHDPARPHFVPWLPSDSVRSRRVGVVPNRLRFPEHVVFTTQNNKPRYQRAYAKAYEVLKDMRVRVGIFNANNVRVNAYGYPYLKDMYLAMMETYPWAHTYTYVNADILFNATAFLQTADALVYASLDGALSTRFLAVGHRRNVAWDASDDFGALLNMSVQFQDDAQDYFITSRALWDWRDLPDLVVGRRAYDNWLVQCAVTLPGVDAVDVTLTNPAVHLTVRSNKDGHSGVSVADVDYNNIVIAREDPKWHPHLGRMSACPMYTELNNESASASCEDDLLDRSSVTDRAPSVTGRLREPARLSMRCRRLRCVGDAAAYKPENVSMSRRRWELFITENTTAMRKMNAIATMPAMTAGQMLYG